MISRKLFIESINAIEAQYTHDEKCSEAFKVILPVGIATYDNHSLSNQLIKLLQELMGDDNSHSWIEYYCYEKEFGKRTDLKVTDNGQEVPLNSPGDLYDLIIRDLAIDGSPLSEAYNAGWLRSRKHYTKTDNNSGRGKSRKGVNEYFNHWFKQYIQKK